MLAGIIPWILPNAGILDNTLLLLPKQPWQGQCLQQGTKIVMREGLGQCPPRGDVYDLRQLQTLLVLVGGEGLEILHKALPT